MAVAVIARGLVSALGSGAAAVDAGGLGEEPPVAWAARHGGKPFARATCCAAERAVRPAALLALALTQVTGELDESQPGWRSRRLAVVIGTSSGGFAALERALVAGAGGGAELWPHSSYFAPLARLPELLGREPDRLVALYGACASSALSLGLGSRLLELGRTDLVIAGGYDAESDWVSAGFDSLKATSAGTPRSFRRERDGMALGEGAALVALSRSAAKAYGFIVGFGATTDAVHITAPDRTGAGLARAATLALSDAELDVEDVGAVSVHGTGTSYNDASEAAALRQVFGGRAESLLVHAFKPSIGHTLGAASALEALAALAALQRGLWPASAGGGSPMPELPARLLERNEPADVPRCLKLATAFGGANAALVLSREPVAARTLAVRAVHLAAAGAPIRALDVERIVAQLVAPLERLPRSDELSSLAIAAAGEVLRAAGELGAGLDRLRTGVVVGSVGSTLEANRGFGQRVLERGVEHAEPRRFPGTSPNAAPGHVAIAFGLGGPSHAVGAGAAAALEAVQVASDWISAGDADAMLVIAAEQVGVASRRALTTPGCEQLESGAIALLLAAAPLGPRVDEAVIEPLAQAARSGQNPGFQGLMALTRAVGLPGFGGFGSVRPPE